MSFFTFVIWDYIKHINMQIYIFLYDTIFTVNFSPLLYSYSFSFTEDITCNFSNDLLFDFISVVSYLSPLIYIDIFHALLFRYLLKPSLLIFIFQSILKIFIFLSNECSHFPFKWLMFWLELFVIFFSALIFSCIPMLLLFSPAIF